MYVGDVTEDAGPWTWSRPPVSCRRPLPLRLVGRCREDLAERLRRRAGELGVSLEIIGPLPHREAMEAAAGASVGFSLLHDLPNYAGSLPTKVIEYLAMGVPVVASDLPGIREALAGRAAVEVVPPGDAGGGGGGRGPAARRGGAGRGGLQAPVVRRSSCGPTTRCGGCTWRPPGVMRS